MPTRRGRRRWSSSRVGRWGIALGVVGSVLALGALDPRVLVACAIVVAAAATLLLREQTLDDAHPRGGAIVLVLAAAGLTVFTLAQIVPLPISWVKALSPHAADVWSRALLPFGESGPPMVPISLDPIATRIEVLKGVAYLSVLLAGLVAAGRREGILFLERVLVGTGALVAVITVVHFALGAERVYGVIAPKTGVSIIAPLLNPNHLSAYLNISLLVALGSIFASRPLAPRALLVAHVLVVAAVQVWLASRGGVASMVVGAAVCIGGVVLVRRDDTRISLLLPMAFVAAGFAMLVLGASPSSMSGLADRDLSKLEVTREVFRRMVTSYPLFGVGRGAFESTFPEFRRHGGFDVFTHPENLAAQWCSEWGLVAGCVAVVAIAYALRPKTILSRGGAAIGAWSALFALALHNLVDFNLEVPGVVFAATVCAAIVTGGTDVAKRASRGRVAEWIGRVRWVHLAVAGATIGAIALVLPVVPRELLEAQRTLRVEAASPSTDDSVFRGHLRAAMLDHPAEPYFPYLGAAHAVVLGRNPMPWIERTLERAPIYASAHVLLARWLRRRSPAQSRLEYRLAAESGLGDYPAAELAPLVTTPDDALELVPAGASGVGTLDALVASFLDTLPSTSDRLDREILARDPAHPRATLRRSHRARVDVELGDAAPWCAGSDECLRVALKDATLAEARAPLEFEGYEDHARVLCATGSCRDGLEVLRHACESSTKAGGCFEALARLAIAGHQDNAATDAIESLAHASCRDDAECVNQLARAAGLEQERGNSNRALVFWRRAVKAAPGRDDLVEELAAAAARANLHAEALDAYTKLLTRHPGDARLESLANLERDRLTGH